MSRSLAVAAAIALLTISVAALPAGADVVEGTYAFSGKRTSAKLVVDAGRRATVRYSARTGCGPANGRMTLSEVAGGRFKGSDSKRLGKRGRRTMRVKAVPEWPAMRLTLSYATRAADGKACHARRVLLAEPRAPSGDANLLPDALTGHYSGASAAGRAISFDLVNDNGANTSRVENIHVEVDTECWNDLDGDGESDLLTARIDGLGGKAEPDGSFEVYYAPDEDTDYEFEGRVRDGVARIEVTVGGYFAADGTPSLSGPLECDNFGEDYTARRQS